MYHMVRGSVLLREEREHDRLCLVVHHHPERSECGADSDANDQVHGDLLESGMIAVYLFMLISRDVLEYELHSGCSEESIERDLRGCKNTRRKIAAQHQLNDPDANAGNREL
jgi:hypothetical protein